jgi:hypothetical protein
MEDDGDGGWGGWLLSELILLFFGFKSVGEEVQMSNDRLFLNSNLK